MADTYLGLSEADKKELLETAAVKLGRQATVLEKDIWICWALQVLFSIPDAHPMAFKGGTSLSKVYQIIDRFSEDVDITLDYRNFGDAFDPFSENASKTQIRKYSDRLKSYVRDYAHDAIVPAIERALEDLPYDGRYAVEVDESGEKIWISYPSVTESNDEYIKSRVLIELGGRNVIDPNERHTISPYVMELTKGLEYPIAEVVVLSSERTFWEKATLIHVECHRDRLKENADRLSRHWYDLVMLGRHASGKVAIHNRELFEDVVRHKQVFFNASYANYDSCLKNKVQLLPEGKSLGQLRIDYEKMLRSGMMYQMPPEFDEIVEAIRQLQQDINRW